MTAVLAILLSLCAASLAALAVRTLFFGYPPARLSAGAALTRKEQALVAAAADALFPAAGPIPLSGTEAGLVEYADAYLRRVPAGQRALIRLLFVFLEHGPFLFGPRRRRFTSLSPEARVEALEDMAKSSIYFRRVAFLSLRTILSMGYLANDAVAQRIGMQFHATPFEAAPVSLVRDFEPTRPDTDRAPVSTRRIERDLQPA